MRNGIVSQAVDHSRIRKIYSLTVHTVLVILLGGEEKKKTAMMMMMVVGRWTTKKTAKKMRQLYFFLNPEKVTTTYESIGIWNTAPYTSACSLTAATYITRLGCDHCWRHLEKNIPATCY